MDDSKSFASGDADHGGSGSEGPIEKICKVLCAVTIVVMLVVIGQDILSRGIWNESLELSDEIGGYMLVALTFLSLSLAKTHGAFHKTDYFQSRLPRKARIASRIAFDLLALAVAAILLWQYFRYTSSRWETGSTAPTRLGTQQWIPAVPMVLGMTAYVLAIIRSTIENIRSFGAATPGGGRVWDSE